VSALLPDVPHPILALFGQHGAAKSSTARLLSAILDTSTATTRSVPANERDFAIAAAASHVVVLDNLSSVRGWLSDALCRTVTGDTYTARRLYTDSDTVVLAFRNATIITAIHPGQLRADLADRLVVVTLPRLTRDQRRDEAELNAEIHESRSAILTGLLDLAVKVLGAMRQVDLPEKPRMADFARVLAGIDAVVGTDGLSTYRRQEDIIAQDVIEGDLVTTTLVELLASLGGHFEGTASALSSELNAYRKEHHLGSSPDWPSNAQALASRLRMATPALTSAGVTVHEPVRTGHMRQRVWHIEDTNATRRQATKKWPASVPTAFDKPDDSGDTNGPVPVKPEPAEVWYPPAGSDPEDIF
jgi:hypothetical protein